jgi:hypothetical protein
MWSQTNERYLDRRGCGDELYLDADLKASFALAGLYGADLFDHVDALDDGDDSAAN